MKKTNYLYRHFDKEGNLLYVGISVNPLNRLCNHKTQSRWYDQIKTVTIDDVGPNRALAEKKEIDAILSEEPKYNIFHNDPDVRAKTKIQEKRQECLIDENFYDYCHKRYYKKNEAIEYLKINQDEFEKLSLTSYSPCRGVIVYDRKDLDKWMKGEQTDE